MKRHVMLVTVALLVGTVLGFAGASSQYKPTELSHIYTSFIGPPPSLHQMVLDANAVVLGRIAAGVSKDVGWYRKSDLGITTTYRFQVREILHSAGNRLVDQHDLTVIRDGGSIDRGTKIEKQEVDGFPQFELGHEYVLFLRWNTVHDAWSPAWGPSGTFELVAGKVFTNGSGDVVKAQGGLTAEEFLTKLRKLSSLGEHDRVDSALPAFTLLAVSPGAARVGTNDCIAVGTPDFANPQHAGPSGRLRLASQQPSEVCPP